jgi:hypothetical protein
LTNLFGTPGTSNPFTGSAVGSTGTANNLGYMEPAAVLQPATFTTSAGTIPTNNGTYRIYTDGNANDGYALHDGFGNYVGYFSTPQAAQQYAMSLPGAQNSGASFSAPSVASAAGLSTGSSFLQNLFGTTPSTVAQTSIPSPSNNGLSYDPYASAANFTSTTASGYTSLPNLDLGLTTG